MYKVPFKRKWQDPYSVEEVLTDKYKFYLFPWEKSLTYHNDSLKDIKKRFNWSAHYAVVDPWKKQRKLPYAPGNQYLCPFQQKSFKQKY